MGCLLVQARRQTRGGHAINHPWSTNDHPALTPRASPHCWVITRQVRLPRSSPELHAHPNDPRLKLVSPQIRKLGPVINTQGRSHVLGLIRSQTPGITDATCRVNIDLRAPLGPARERWPCALARWPRTPTNEQPSGRSV